MGLITEALGDKSKKATAKGADSKEGVAETCELKDFKEFHRNTHH